ncbi:MAG: IS91 family transposase [Oscillospiraceae bacterium]|nr:IS91 family transposase [Oscillospiraceae bacterium]
MIELQDIIQEHGGGYVKGRNLLPVQHKALNAIAICRTARLGGHVDHYDCGHTNISYNSCRNRNCPKCQALTKERWVMARMDDLLPVPYYHVVFTLPQELNRLAFIDNATIYDLLMRASAETLKALCLSPRYLSAEVGFITVLHTWGQNLVLHPHVHIVIPAGGLTTCGKFVVGSKKFFLPVKVMAKLFRGKFLFHLKSIRERFGAIEKDEWNDLITILYGKDWYVYCKRPFKNPGAVLQYLGRYTHRVAISNHRILSMNDGVVTFSYRDYKDGSKKKIMQLAVNEFIRRFLLHVLPSGFRKIRHYGFLAPAAKKQKLKLCRKLLRVKFTPSVPLSTKDLLQKLTGRDIGVCPICGKGTLFSATGLSPPNNVSE